MRRMLKSKSGMAMVYVILIAVVITVVGVTIWQVSVNDEFRTEKQKSEAQAYYYAKSGVEIAVGYIMNGITTFNPGAEGQTFYGKLGDANFYSTPQYDANGKKNYNVMVKIVSKIENGEKKFVISSTGFASIAGTDSYADSGGAGGGAEATSDALGFEITQDALEKSVEGSETIDVDEKTPPVIGSDFACNYAVFTEEDIDLDDGSPTIFGEIGTNSGKVKMNYSSNVYNMSGGNGKIFLGPGASTTHPQWRGVNWEEIAFKPKAEIPAVPAMPAFPVFPDYAAYPSAPNVPGTSGLQYTTDITGSKSITLAKNSKTMYRKISIGWNDTVTFALNGDNYIIVDDFSCSGQIKLTGTGHLFLYIKGSIPSNRMLINTDGDPKNLTIYSAGTSVGFGSSSILKGDLYAPNATISTSYATNITGDILTNGTSVDLGSSTVIKGNLYAKNATINTGDSCNITGNVQTDGKSINIGSSNTIIGNLYAKNATISTGYGANIKGDILAGGTSLTFNGLSHNGSLYAQNANTIIQYNGNRSYVSGTATNIISKGKELNISPDNIKGNIFLYNSAAIFRLDSSSMLTGNVLTLGNTVNVSGSATLKGHIVATNPNVIVNFSGSGSNVGSIISNGPSVTFTGGSTAIEGIVYAPKAAFNLTGGAMITGSVTSKSFTADGGTRLTYKEIVLKDMPVAIQPSKTAGSTTTNWRVYGTWVKE